MKCFVILAIFGLLKKIVHFKACFGKVCQNVIIILGKFKF